MPNKESEIDHETMKRLVRTHLCAICQSILTVAWSAGHNCFILRCGNDINHEGITRHDKKREAEIEKYKEGAKLQSKDLMVMPEKDMMARIGVAKFPQELNQSDKKLLAQAAITYGFDPIMGEITIYQGRPYVSIDGRYRKAHETGDLDGVETRPATKQERLDWEIPDGDYFFRAEVYVKGTTRPYVGWGRVRKTETVGGKGFKPVETNPQRMAEKRAEAQALRKAFFIPIPSIEEIGAEPEMPKVTIEQREIETPKANTAPELEKSEQTVVSTETEQETSESKPSVKLEAPGSKPDLQINPSDITSLSGLIKVCKDKFDMNGKQVFDELNIQSSNDWADSWSNAYRKIAESRK